MSTQAPYHHTQEIHNMQAPRSVVPIIMQLLSPESVLDVGCGTGTWLKAFQENGVNDYVGVDGDYLDRSLLQIDKANFRVQDLRKEFNLNRRFDLIVSLEVAEHVEEHYADNLVQSLINHGDAILFSAAIPGQGGQHHVNEQWPAYWCKKFESRGYSFHDVVRPLIWNIETVDWWYKQNIFLVKKGKAPASDQVNALVHPDLYSLTIRNQQHYVDSLKSGKQGLKVSFQIFLNALSYKIKTFIGGK